MTDRLPFKLGRFQITARLGTGSMGIVYKGEDPLIGREVAIKVIRTEVLDDADRCGYRERFMREARSVGRCIHPGIVTVHDVGEENGDPFIVMAYVEGQTLQRQLSAGPMPKSDAVDITLQLLSALGHAHERGVVHRDIKPANIIMSNGRAIITDFGIARLNTAGLTLPGLLLGTPNYMSPEQARGQANDHRADLFAVGMVLLRMVTGILPFQDASVAAVLRHMASPTPIDLKPLETIDQRLASVVAVALAKEVDQRFQTADEFAHMLKAMTVNRSEEEIWISREEEKSPPSQPTAPASRAPVQEISWPATMLPELTGVLAGFMGPIAKVLVTRAVQSAVSVDELLESLAQNISDPAQRHAFATAARPVAQRHLIESAEAPEEGTPAPEYRDEAVAADELAAPASAETPTDDPVVLSSYVLSSAQTILSRFIGPIARVLVRRASLEPDTVQGFGEQLASYIDRPEERDAFKREFERELIGKERADLSRGGR